MRHKEPWLQTEEIVFFKNISLFMMRSDYKMKKLILLNRARGLIM